MYGADGFAENLREHLRARRWHASDLAVRLHVDPSLVRRWLRGDRVPALGSHHVERIAAVLELTLGERRHLELAQVAGLRALAARPTELGPTRLLMPALGSDQAIALELEERPGDRLVVGAGLSELVVPPAWLAAPSPTAPACPGPEHCEAILAGHRRRLAAFHAQVGVCRFREIASRATFERFARDGQTNLLGGALGERGPGERADLLRHAAALLDAHPLFELALADEGDEAPLSTVDWLVKGDHAVLLRVGDAGGQRVWIVEPAIVAAFREHFEELWERVEPAHRDRREVTAFLRGLAARLRD